MATRLEKMVKHLVLDLVEMGLKEEIPKATQMVEQRVKDLAKQVLDLTPLVVAPSPTEALNLTEALNQMETPSPTEAPIVDPNQMNPKVDIANQGEDHEINACVMMNE